MGSPETGPICERFWKRVKITDDPKACWTWKGYICLGYGRFHVDGARIQAHRYGWSLFNGPVPSGLMLDHLCRNKSCVRFDHLELVTNRVNVLRGVGPTAENAQKTHCPAGHDYSDPRNTRIGKTGWRKCRACSREYQARYAKKKRNGAVERFAAERAKGGSNG